MNVILVTSVRVTVEVDEGTNTATAVQAAIDRVDLGQLLANTSPAADHVVEVQHDEGGISMVAVDRGDDLQALDYPTLEPLINGHTRAEWQALCAQEATQLLAEIDQVHAGLSGIAEQHGAAVALDIAGLVGGLVRGVEKTALAHPSASMEVLQALPAGAAWCARTRAEALRITHDRPQG